MNDQYLVQLTRDIGTARDAAASARILADRSTTKAREVAEWTAMYEELKAEHVRLLGKRSVFA